ncbi:hypothetical protein Tco_0979685, partial [Tanacetum coccineum]
VMAISTILISLDSSEDSVGTPSGRVLWFGRIPTTVPATTPTIDPPFIHDDTPLIPTETPTISPITSTIPPIAHPTHYTSLFIHTDSFDDDTPDTPPSPTHEIPPVEVAPPTGQILPAPFGVRRRRVTIVSPGQPIPYGRPYRYHPNGPVHMITARKKVGPLPTHRLAVRHSVDYSSSHHFISDDSSRDSPSDSSSDSSSDAYPILHLLCSSVPSIPYSSAAITERPSHSSFAGPSRKRSRSPTTYVLIYSPILGVLSSVRADLLPPRKRIRSSDYVTDLEVSSDESSESSIPRETGSRVDVDARDSDEPYLEPDIDPEVQTEIDECIAYVDALRAGGIDARVVVETGEGAIEVTYVTLGDLGHKIVATGQQSVILSERISELERDNTRLRGTLDVASQRVTRLQRRELRVHREMKQIRRLRFYDRVRIGRLEACARKHLGYRP